MLSFPSFPFNVLFLPVFWSKFTVLFKFSSKKTNHILTKPSALFLSPVSLSSCPLRFHVSPNLSIVLFLFLELSFFCFRYQTVFFEYLLRFYVHFFRISLLGFQEVATFDFSSWFWLAPFHEGGKMISLRPRVITANSSQLFKFSTIFLTSRFTFIYTLAPHSSHNKNVLFFIPRHARPKEGGE